MMSRELITCTTLGASLILSSVSGTVPPVFGDEASAAQFESISFGRDIAPILSANCFECHGPDESQRQAGLRLDQRDSARSPLDSGGIAVVPGDISRSLVIRRITTADEFERMPPVDSNRELTSREIQLLESWIQQGAAWNEHWAFKSLDRRPLPATRVAAWVRTPVDAFVLNRLRDAGLKPAAPAERRTLVRRVYFDLIGMPPTADQIAAFELDQAPDAYSRLVDRLLASPHYGERWGRYWLDVARYGDSNGGDENHLYPHAFRYRNYVIDAWNRGIPYDEFIRQQIAGDLLDQNQSRDSLSALTATGFLAIGMKILAEQDPVKKRADIVDEQLDTFGRSILGLTLGCARCHDHKFDPVPTNDYYAMAGIFHSTDIIDRKLETAEYLQAKADYEQAKADMEDSIAQLEQKIAGTANAVTIVQAEAFARGNVSVINEGYGEQIGVISDPGSQDNFAEYDIGISRPGEYVVQLRYAAKESRPGRILVNGKVVKDHAIARKTGGWYPVDQKWFTEGSFAFSEGVNVLRLESRPMMSHIDQLRLVRADETGEVVEYLAELKRQQDRLAKFSEKQPSAQMAMAVREGEVSDVRVHVRGSHLSLGQEVPRGFLSVFQAGERSLLGADRSGRRELADWLTRDTTPAASLTSRVIANRIWAWHFGQGLVATPDNFGLQGGRPTHPLLLDWLALRLIDYQWSIKHLHREIVLSSTYRMASLTPDTGEANGQRAKLYAARLPKRVEAEVFRDSLLFVAESLDESLAGAPPNVKSGDPSPDDLRKNRMAYEQSRRRSVYLPIVRSNVYKLLTLLDFPDSATPVGKRSSTIVPTQSLLLMNSSFVVQQAQRIAERAGSEGTEARERVRLLYVRLFGRSANDEEESAVLRFLEAFVQTGASEQDAWTALCHTLVTSHEFFYIP